MTLSVRRTGASDYGQYMKVLICGPAGSGKTLISSTAPNPIYASAEGGLMSIADRGIPYSEIRSSSDLLEFKNGVDQAPKVRENLFGFPVDTVVVDTIDEIQHILIQERIKESKQESLQLKDWGWLGEQMQAIIRGFRNIEANVIFLCHIKETSDGDTGRVWNKPGLQGAIADQIANFVDLSMLLKAHTTTVVEDGVAAQKTVRFLQTSPEPMYPWIKDRSGKLPAEIEVTFDGDIVRLKDMIFGGVSRTRAYDDSNPTPIVQFDSAPSVSAPPAEEESTPVESSEPARRAPSVTEPKLAPVETDSEANPELSDLATVKPPRVEVTSPQQLPRRRPLVEIETEKPKLTDEATDDMTCQACGGQIENGDVRDLSRIRYRESLCRSCFQAKRKKA